MTDLLLANLEKVMVDVWVNPRDLIRVEPTTLIVPSALHKQALKILFYRKPMGRRKGARGRKRSLYWR